MLRTTCWRAASSVVSDCAWYFGAPLGLAGTAMLASSDTNTTSTPFRAGNSCLSTLPGDLALAVVVVIVCLRLAAICWANDMLLVIVSCGVVFLLKIRAVFLFEVV